MSADDWNDRAARAMGWTDFPVTPNVSYWELDGNFVIERGDWQPMNDNAQAMRLAEECQRRGWCVGLTWLDWGARSAWSLRP